MKCEMSTSTFSVYSDAAILRITIAFGISYILMNNWSGQFCPFNWLIMLRLDCKIDMEK